MNSFLLVQLAVFAALVGGSFFWRRHKRAAHARVLREGLSELDTGVVVDEKTGTAVCMARGFKVHFRFTTRGSGSSSESWSEADVDVDPSPLTLHIRPQTLLEERAVRKGLAVDVQIGEIDFDALFLVEAAPTELVRSALARDVQERLIALKPDELSTGSFRLRLAKRGWNENPYAIQEFVNLAAAIAERITAAVTAAVSAAAPPAAPYRGQEGAALDRPRLAAGRQNLAAQHAAEVQHVEQVRAKRQKRQKLVFFGVLLGVAAVVAYFSLKSR